MNPKRFFLLLALVIFGVQCFGQTPVWTQMPGSPGGTTRHDDIFFINETNGWSARGRGGIFKTTDAGRTWRQVLTNSNTHFRSIGFLTPLHGFAGNLGAGSYDTGVTDTNNVLYETFDGGETWTNHPGLFEQGMKGFCAMHVLDSQHIYGVGRVRGPAHFAKSEDGGTNWTVVDLTPNSGLGVMGGMMDVFFKDPTNGFAVGMDTNTYASGVYHGRIVKTTDGGSSWTPVAETTPLTGCYFWKMSWPTPQVGYASLQQNAASSSLIFYKTIDGGNTWISNGIPYATIGIPSFSLLQGIGFVSTNEGWVGGPNTSSTFANSFLHTTNGGASWTPEGYTDSRQINRIRVYPKFVVASGGKLHIYKVPLAITTQPQSQTNSLGTTANLNVFAQGAQPLSFQWRFNGSNIALANTNFYSITNFQSTNAGNYDVMVSDFSGSVTSAVATLTLEGSPSAPTIETQPQNQTVAQNSNATFTVGATGTAPLSYQWQFAGGNLFGATGTSFTRANAQLADAGNYSVVVTNAAGSVTSSVATLTVLTTNVLFAADFDSYSSPVIVTNVGTTNGYKIFYRASTGPVDFKAVFGFDYSAVTYPTTIPSAPHTIGGTTKGLFLTVNKDATADVSAVNLYPTNQFFSGEFALKFDMWINWANPNTSTEHTLIGINHSGNVTNRIGVSPSDGLFFAVAGDDDSLPTSGILRDYSVFRGANGAPVLMITNNTTFGPAPLLSPLFENYDPGFTNLFPSQTFPVYGSTPPGTAGLRWLNGEIRQHNGLITWLLNGTIIAQYTNTFSYTNGNILLGYNDNFSSIGDSNNFVVFDNIRVEPFVPAPVTILSPHISGNNFSFSLLTEWGESYVVQKASSLAPPDWVTHTNLAGDGALKTITVPLATEVMENYFRVVRP